MQILKSALQLSSLFSYAFEWLCKNRENHPSGSDIWDFRKRWNDSSDKIIKMFADGSYEFGLQQKITLASGDTIAMWSSQDSLVLKVLTRGYLPNPPKSATALLKMHCNIIAFKA